MKNLTSITINKVRKSNNVMSNYLKEQYENSKTIIDFSYTTVGGIFMALIMFYYGILSETFLSNLKNTNFSVIGILYMILLLIPIFMYIDFLKFSLDDMGLNSKNLKKNLLFGLILSISGSIVLVAIFYIYISISSLLGFVHEYNFNYETLNTNVLIVYFVFAAAQEVFCIGVVVNLLNYYTKNKVVSVLAPALIFALIHIRFGFLLTMLTFIMLTMLTFIMLTFNSLLFLRIKTIIPGMMLHFVGGILVVVLGIMVY